MVRKYVHHNKKERPNSLSISLGSVKDSFEYLKQLCNDKSVELLQTIEVNEDNKIDVIFWTEDFPELIGISHFIKDKNGYISFRLDFSETTL
ncbi:MAG: hypothetical protein IJ328_07200 [Muribaculaceae bacterium]|nr:hypothetical protein [Muribaculaceae bacterium]